MINIIAMVIYTSSTALTQAELPNICATSLGQRSDCNQNKTYKYKYIVCVFMYVLCCTHTHTHTHIYKMSKCYLSISFSVTQHRADTRLSISL